MNISQSGYRGRFAPSPSGPLHFGSLVAALASYLDARQAGGRWLLRMEDIDPLREVPGAASSILKSLEAHGLLWDESVQYQSQRLSTYQDILADLQQRGLVYPCPCSRKELRENAQQHRADCRQRRVDSQQAHALRFALKTERVEFDDLIQGWQEGLISDADDFIVRRRDGYFAYQLVVVVDDYEQSITTVIRGSDLLESTPLQLKLYNSLEWIPPAFGHFPVVVDGTGKKLSKQHFSPSIASRPALLNLSQAALVLKLIAPGERLPDTPEELIKFLLPKWSRARYTSQRTLLEPESNQNQAAQC